jgi:1-acyl-sn-glycerol-3-phosphate acyltransferase
MTARPGAARLALKTGYPVIPVGQWGANFIMPGKRPGWPRLWPRRTLVFRTGAPVDLSDLAGRTDSEAVVAAGVRIMDAVTALVAQIRQADPPEGVYDIRVGARVPRG